MFESVDPLGHSRSEFDAIMARADALFATLPEPAASMAEALSRVFTPGQLDELWQNRDEAMKLIAADARERREELAGLEDRIHALWSDYRRHFPNIRSADPARHDEWFQAHVDEISWIQQQEDHIGQLKTTLRELDSLYAEFEANTVAPAHRAG